MKIASITQRKILFSLANWTLLLAGIVNLGAGTSAALAGSPTLAATSLTAGLVLLFAATIERFESLKGLGIEATTRKLDEKLVQADEALGKLKEITEIASSAILDLNSKAGRFAKVQDPSETIALGVRVHEIMKSVGSSDDVIAITLEPWARTLCFDIAFAQVHGIKLLLKARLSELENVRKAIPKPMMANDPVYTQTTSQITAIGQYKSQYLETLHLIELQDFPVKFMALFHNVPEIPDESFHSLRLSAKRFVPGMLALSKNQKLPDPELWIEEIRELHAGKRVD